MFSLNVVLILLLTSFFVVSNFFSLYAAHGRFRVAFCNLFSSLKSSVFSIVPLFVLFYSLLILNVVGNIPTNLVPTLFYSETLTLSLLFWLPIIICVFIYDFKRFLSHMLPYGAPVALIVFLPIIEIFSQLIRPFTLIIRLSTNLSRGHIMIYMFSYFTLLNPYLYPFIRMVISLLLVLEFCISALQAYIFVSLLVLYLEEVS